MKNLQINPKLTIKRIPVPDTEQQVYIIDDFLLDTDSVINFAHNIAYLNPMFSDNSYYPGMRDHMPMPYQRLLATFFEENIKPEITNEAEAHFIFHKCLLSLITCPPEQLSLEQKMPHVDSLNKNDFACVHYLSSAELGGTSIYKYRPKNIIEFNPQDENILDDMANNTNNTPNEHSGYISQSTSLFEQVINIEAKFNRLVIYQGNLLHSANVISQQSYCGDLVTGRLSVASFCTITNQK